MTNATITGHNVRAIPADWPEAFTPDETMMLQQGQRVRVVGTPSAVMWSKDPWVLVEVREGDARWVMDRYVQRDDNGLLWILVIIGLIGAAKYA